MTDSFGCVDDVLGQFAFEMGEARPGSIGTCKLQLERARGGWSEQRAKQVVRS